MSVIYIVLPLALIVVAIAVGAYVWAARSGQFDDTKTPAIRPLIDDDEVRVFDPSGRTHDRLSPRGARAAKSLARAFERSGESRSLRRLRAFPGGGGFRVALFPRA